MKAIDKAWSENLQEPKCNQWESKEDLIENCCPYGEYSLKIKGFEDDEQLCEHFNENCTKCWDSGIQEDEKEENTYNNKSELTFEKLKESPINEMYFSDITENNFIKNLKTNEYIINCEDGVLTYDDIHKTIKWLQEVYDYCTELKNKTEYVDFMTAKEHMRKGGDAKFEEYTYYIVRDKIYCHEDSEECAFSLKTIESDKWILL
ncbi:hypothetical protein [Clostridium beijerinckii]|uniref:hypothetical protein n=1 Tax=Clostridium beijerinckii TaxID=1520 RepID=UPI00156F63A3|nr:hypothetical protein [Clostridium beijerinckii]NRU52629.1 hypothetical protein [Clostridium beijerinckii]NYC68672.1 hypothetical protein [Clostridium beijerinckii]NYC91821.1 hypothetical protein [Clostridium beijerinckii]